MDYDLIVIGGGVSGIAAAAQAAQAGRRVLLLEAGERLGGCVHTWWPREDFWLELGAHTAYNSYGALLGLQGGDDPYGQLIARAKVGYHFFEAGRPRSPMSRLSFLEAALHLPRGLGKPKAGRSVRDYYSALLGTGNWRRLLAPAFAAVLSQPADDYPADWLFRRKPRVKAAPRKFTHAAGLQGWLESLVAARGVDVALGHGVTAVEAAPGGARVVFDDGAVLARRVLIATPAQEAGRLLAPFVPDLASRLAATPVAEIATRAVVLPRTAVRLPPVAGLIGGDDAFYSAVSRDYLPHPEWRGFAFHFKPDCLDADGQRRRMAEVLGCRVEDFTHETVKVNRLPRLDPASVDLAAALGERLAGGPVDLVGNYLNGLSLGDAAQYAVDRAGRPG